MAINLKNIVNIVAKKAAQVDSDTPSSLLSGYLNILERQGGGTLLQRDTIAGDELYDLTELILKTNGSITDQSKNGNTVTLRGNTAQSSTQTKYADQSIYFPGASGDGLDISNIPLIGTKDFTIEFWMYPDDPSGTWQTLISNSYNVAGGWRLYKTDAQTELTWYEGANAVITTSGANLGSQWHHIVVQRKGAQNFLQIFVDGISRGSVLSNTTNHGHDAADPISIGCGNTTYEVSEFPYEGYIEDLRITTGYARHNGSFGPFPDIGPTGGPLVPLPTQGPSQEVLPFAQLTPVSSRLTYLQGTDKFSFRRNAGWSNSKLVDQTGQNAGFIYGGLNPDLAGTTTQIQRFSFVSPGVATDAGDLNETRGYATGLVDYTNDASFIAGGTTDPTLTPTSPLALSSIERHLGANTVTVTQVGDLSNTSFRNSSASSTTHGYIHLSDGGAPNRQFDKFSFSSSTSGAPAGLLEPNTGDNYACTTDYINQRGLIAINPGTQTRQFPMTSDTPFTTSAWAGGSPNPNQGMGALANPAKAYLVKNGEIKIITIASGGPVSVFRFNYDTPGVGAVNTSATAASEDYGWFVDNEPTATGVTIQRFPFAAEIPITWATCIPAPTYTGRFSTGSHY